MIVDTIENSFRYLGCHPGFKEAFAFIQHFKTEVFENKKVAVNDSITAIIEQAYGRTHEGAPLEAHRKYIDIQYIYEGIDEMGYKPKIDCENISVPYQAKRDIEFFSDTPTTWLSLKAGNFVIFFPEDAHAPLAGAQEVKKIIMKVAVN